MKRKAGGKPSCVMYGHQAKASISFTKPLNMSKLRLNNLLLLSPGENQKAALIHACSLIIPFLYPVFMLLLFFFFLVFRLSHWLLFSVKPLKVKSLCSIFFGFVDKTNRPNLCCFGNPWLKLLMCFPSLK